MSSKEHFGWEYLSLTSLLMAIVNGAGYTATLVATVKSSVLWNHIHIFTLNTPIQSMGDPRFTA
jgi:hypothetical protein